MKPKASPPRAAKDRNPACEPEWIASILENIALIESIVAHGDEAVFLADPVAQKAVKMCLIEISEAAGRLTLELQARHPDQPWRAIEDLRNVYTHEYHVVDMRLMWRTARQRLDALRIILVQESNKHSGGRG